MPRGEERDPDTVGVRCSWCPWCPYDAPSPSMSMVPKSARQWRQDQALSKDAQGIRPAASASVTSPTAAEVLAVSDLIDGCFGKRQSPEVGVDFAVDDDASVVQSYGGY